VSAFKFKKKQQQQPQAKQHKSDFLCMHFLNVIKCMDLSDIKNSPFHKPHDQEINYLHLQCGYLI
jgi:hypothetical protein